MEPGRYRGLCLFYPADLKSGIEQGGLNKGRDCLLGFIYE